MSAADYVDFDLEIVRLARGKYQARVIESPAGQASAEFRRPFSDLELENFLLKFGHPRTGLRSINSVEMQSAEIFGKRLFDAVFRGAVRECLTSCLHQVDRNEIPGLRIKMRLVNVPELASLPWEYLYHPTLRRFIVLSTKTPITRYVDLPRPVMPLTLSPPLRLLVVAAGPSDYPTLDIDREKTKLRTALRDLERRGLIVLEWLEPATLFTLQQRLRRQARLGPVHFFHFIGHGGWDEQAQDGVLLFEDEYRRGDSVKASRLATILCDHRSLRLVMLNACEGARTSPTDPFAGVAATLIQQGIPAVVAMQFEITDDAAIELAQEFYGSLADGYPAEAALSEARKAIFASGNKMEWGTPVLYLRSPDGRLFSLANIEQTILSDGQPVAFEEKLTEPLPSYDPGPTLEIPSGVVRPNSPFYVERPADQRLHRQVLGLGTTTTIRAGRQTGKTSLLMRGIQAAKQEKRSIVYLDFQTIEVEHRKTLDSLLRHLADEMAFQLDIDPSAVDKAWKSLRGTPDKFNQFLKTSVLAQAESPILLAIDEADQLLDVPYKTDFFASIRAWDSLRAFDIVWSSLNVVMVISTHPYVLIENVSQSPFNVGVTLELQDFDVDQVVDLNHRHGNPIALHEIPEVMSLLGGQPYLVRQALYTVVDQKITWDGLAAVAGSDQGPFGKHLRFYLEQLKKRPELVKAMRQVIEHHRCSDEAISYRLIAAGLAKEVAGECICRCGLYEAYFKEKLR